MRQKCAAWDGANVISSQCSEFLLYCGLSLIIRFIANSQQCELRNVDTMIEAKVPLPNFSRQTKMLLSDDASRLPNHYFAHPCSAPNNSLSFRTHRRHYDVCDIPCCVVSRHGLLRALAYSRLLRCLGLSQEENKNRQQVSIAIFICCTTAVFPYS